MILWILQKNCRTKTLKYGLKILIILSWRLSRMVSDDFRRKSFLLLGHYVIDFGQLYNSSDTLFCINNLLLSVTIITTHIGLYQVQNRILSGSGLLCHGITFSKQSLFFLKRLGGCDVLFSFLSEYLQCVFYGICLFWIWN